MMIVGGGGGGGHLYFIGILHTVTRGLSGGRRMGSNGGGGCEGI